MFKNAKSSSKVKSELHKNREGIQISLTYFLRNYPIVLLLRSQRMVLNYLPLP